MEVFAIQKRTAMIMLTLLAVSSTLALNTVPVHAESPGDVMKTSEGK